jgi:enolase-phosphatase E1
LGCRALILDVEGTTTPIDFVYQTLFPYARERVGRFLSDTWLDPATRADVALLRAEHETERDARSDWRDDAEAVTAWVLWLMDRDRKSTGLKSLQGRIWKRGFENGELRGLVYDDVRPALERWTRQGRRVAIFSSGSVLAQRLLFGHSSAGDLTPFLSGYFDTTSGAKREAESYRRIATALGESVAQLLFLSDVTAELEAASAAGLQVALCVRHPAPAPPAGYRVLRSFDELP